MSDYYQNFLRTRKDKHTYRVLPQGALNYDFASNDYLGLKNDPRLLQDIHEYDSGAGSSRLLRDQSPYEEAEAKIAAAKSMEACLLFPSGYQANLTALSTLLNPAVLGTRPLVFGDRFNHRSMHDGCTLARAVQIRYNHLDYTHLEDLLRREDTPENRNRPRFILSESVFSMDGDRADIMILSELARRYGALLYIDEAHSTGVFGPGGHGMCAEHPGAADIIIGTCSKALGAQGGFVACSKEIAEVIIQTGGGFVYSTGLSPVLAKIIGNAWDLLPSLQSRRDRLLTGSDSLRARLREAGFDTGASSTPIIPVMIGDDATVNLIRQSAALMNIRLAAIRPPTVPDNTARMRISLNALHTDTDIGYLTDFFETIALQYPAHARKACA